MTIEPGRQVRPFADFLLDHRQGRTHTDLSEALVELVEAVQETGKKGSLSLTLTVKPEGSRQVLVTDKVAVKAPEGERDASFFFIDDDANLTRDNPTQPHLPLREVGDDQPDAQAEEATGS